jgi:hypothetical protein
MSHIIHNADTNYVAGPIVYISAVGRGMVIFNTLESASGFMDRRGHICDSRPRLIGGSVMMRFGSLGNSIIFFHYQSPMSYSVAGCRYLACVLVIGINSIIIVYGFS